MNGTSIGMRPEIELLLCCRPGAGPETAARIRNLIAQPGFDWDFAVRAAGFHAMRSMLHWTLNEHCPDVVPAHARDTLREAFHFGARRNLAFTTGLIEIVDLMRSRDIPVLTLKGPALALSAYGNLAMRQFADLDILIRKQDVQRAAEALISIGYCQEPPMDWAPENSVIEWNSELSFGRGETSVDLHWEFAPSHFPFRLDPDTLWSTSEAVEIAGRSVPTLGPEHLVLFLCVHGAKHLWERIGWVLDVAQLVHLGGQNWAQTALLASNLGLFLPLQTGVLLANRFFGVPFPDGFPPPGRAARAAVNVVEARLAAEPVERPTTIQLMKFNMRLASSKSNQLRHLAGLIFNPTRAEWERLRLPRPLFFFYPVYRFSRLIAKYAKAIPGGGYSITF